MTCIVGAIDAAGDIYIGGDSSAISEYDMLTISSPKVFKQHGFIYGFAGHFRFGQIIQYHFVPPKRTTDDIASYMICEFASALQEAARDAGFLKTIDGRERGGLAIVGYQGRMFMMQDEFEMLEIHDAVVSIGVGYPYALGAMRALNHADDRPVRDRVELALSISEYYSGAVRAPFTVLGLDYAREEPCRKRDSKRNRTGKKQSAR